EYFTELSTSAGLGISGPFSVTTQEPFTVPQDTKCVGQGCLVGAPFGTNPFPPPPSNLNGVRNLVNTQAGLSAGNFDFLFGGYNPKNKLPYSENWSFDLQWQPKNDVVLTLGYLGNRGVHQPLPIPFNQPSIATPGHPVNGQIYSYGNQATDSSFNPLVTE